jgi:phenylacetate-coenzyme A ligase PaaK-like adenylate-forming protein
MDKYKIRWVHGYPSTVTEFVNLFPSLNNRIEYATVSSETLMEYQSSLLNSLGIKVINHYGMSEGVINISCIDGVWISDDDFALLKRPEKSGVSAAIGTSYMNLAFPLINYSVDDSLVFDNQNVIGILGRQDDYLALPSGKKLYRLDHLFKGLEAINKAQLVQSNKESVTCILSISKADTSSVNEIESTIKTRLSNMIAEPFDIKFDYKRDFILSKNGKVKMVVNKMK